MVKCYIFGEKYADKFIKMENITSKSTIRDVKTRVLRFKKLFVWAVGVEDEEGNDKNIYYLDCSHEDNDDYLRKYARGNDCLLYDENIKIIRLNERFGNLDME